MTGMFKPKTPKIEEAPVTPMPDENDPQIEQARRRRIIKSKQASSQASTLLTGSSGEKLGG